MYDFLRVDLFQALQDLLCKVPYLELMQGSPSIKQLLQCFIFAVFVEHIRVALILEKSVAAHDVGVPNLLMNPKCLQELILTALFNKELVANHLHCIVKWFVAVVSELVESGETTLADARAHSRVLDGVDKLAIVVPLVFDDLIFDNWLERIILLEFIETLHYESLLLN